MYFYFASWGKRTTGAILPLANTIGSRQNSSRSVFASWGKINTAFWHFQNLTRKCLFGIRVKSTAGLIVPLEESNCLDCSNDKDQWRLVVKMAGRAAKFHLWLNIHWIVFLPLTVYNGVSSHSSSPKPIKLVIFSCPYWYIENIHFSFKKPNPNPKA